MVITLEQLKTSLLAVKRYIHDVVDNTASNLKRQIPTNNNQLTNGAGYATQAYVDGELAGKESSLSYGTVIVQDIGKPMVPKTIAKGRVTEWKFDRAQKVKDVQINDISVVTDGVAKIPMVLTNYGRGLVQINSSYGIKTFGNGFIGINSADQNQEKLGVENNRPIVPSNQHISTFYGLAKVAGDTTQSASDNAVGTYTDEAKSAIKAMLDITGECQTVTVTGATPVIAATQNTRYVCGEVTSLDFTPSANGICDVIFTSGSTVTVLTLPSTVILPSWFDATALEANTTYEISISDGVYGAVMVWQ